LKRVFKILRILNLFICRKKDKIFVTSITGGLKLYAKALLEKYGKLMEFPKTGKRGGSIVTLVIAATKKTLCSSSKIALFSLLTIAPVTKMSS